MTTEDGVYRGMPSTELGDVGWEYPVEGKRRAQGDEAPH